MALSWPISNAKDTMGRGALSARQDFPVASYVYERIVSLPIYPKMTDEEVDYVIDNVIKIIKENKK